MARFLISVTKKDLGEKLKNWLGDRHECIIVSPEDGELESFILDMEYDLGLIDEHVFNIYKGVIKRRKFKEYPLILPFVSIIFSQEEKSISELWAILDDVISTPVKRFELYMRLDKLLRYRKMTLTLHYFSVIDHLTGFFNYKYLLLIGDQEYQQAKRYKRRLSAICMSIDNLKTISNTYGHMVSNNVIRFTAQRCYLSMRLADIPGRYGEHEFMFILPETPLKNSAITAERFRSIIGKKPIMVDGFAIPLTASFGVAEMSNDMKDINALFKKAEKAMLIAKGKGGNRVEVSE